MAWSIDKTRDEMRHWVQSAKNAQLQFRDQVEAIQQKLPETTSDNLALLAPHLQRLAVWESLNGAVQVLNDQPEGWERIQHGLSLRYWALRMTIYRFDLSPVGPGGGIGYFAKGSPRAQLVQASLCLVHLLATGEWERAAWLGQRVEAEFGTGPFGTWSGTPLEPFSVALYQIWKSLPLGRGLPTPECLRPYRFIFEAWNKSPQEFSSVLRTACDYHTGRVSDPGDEDFPEFYYALYDVFPAEILAIRRVRTRLGLETVMPNHPLLQTPLADPPSGLSMMSGPTLGEVLARANQVWPNFTD
jgi:hypothetical protein